MYSVLQPHQLRTMTKTTLTVTAALLLCFPSVIFGTEEVIKLMLPAESAHLWQAHQSRSFPVKRVLSCSSGLNYSLISGGGDRAGPLTYSPAHSPPPELKTSSMPTRSNKLGMSAPNSLSARMASSKKKTEERDHIYTKLQKQLYPELMF